MTTLSPSQLGLLADDLTGACDLAGIFAARLGPATVQVTPPGAGGVLDSLSVINMQSRLLSAAESRARHSAVGPLVADRSVVFVKVDLALRGTPGAALAGLQAALGGRRVLVAPAIPSLDRTTRGGRQYDGDVPIDRTPYAADPVSPIRSADVVALLAATGCVECLVCDAETAGDLRRVVARGLDGGPVILAGSLGLALALAEQVAYPTARPHVRPLPPGLRTLLICGSAYARSRAQIDRAISLGLAEARDVDPASARMGGWTWPPDGKALALRLAPRPGSLERADPLAGFVRAMVAAVLELAPDGLGIIGGETAYGLLRGLGAGQLAVYGRLSEVIACGAVASGSLAGRRLATKGGSVGPEDAAVQMLKYLRAGTGVTA